MIYNQNTDILADIGNMKVEKVLAFDGDGNALILDTASGVLRPANSHPGFTGLLWRQWDAS